MENYNDLQTWIDLAKLLERGKFDALFLADVIGVYDVFNGGRAAAISQAAQVPVNDPMLLVPAMAAATSHLGLAFTGSIFQHHPFTFARLISTLDHLSNGRIAWNVVTSYLESMARSYGKGDLPQHDKRYNMADEYCELCYKLWESSWEDDAVIKDVQRRVYADPSKVHDVVHDGEYYQLAGCHLSEPSPQRTPVLYQAGSSPRGQQFAARHAECVFLTVPTPDVAAQYTRVTREQAKQNGRDPEKLLFFTALKLITASTEKEVREKYDAYAEQVTYDGAMALLSGWTGYDFGKLEPDQPLASLETNNTTSFWQSFTKGNTDENLTLRDLARYVGIGGAQPGVFGTPETIVAELENWIKAGVDGFNIAYAETPGSFEDFIDGVAPILQRKGLMQTEYAPGTLREKLFGKGHARVSGSHPAAVYRASN